MGRGGCGAIALMLLGGGLASAAPYTGPWDPAAERDAEAVVARLGGRTSILIVAPVVDVVGLGGARDVIGQVQDVRQAMKQLNASETAAEVHVALPADVLFDFDKADIRADAASALARVATIIRAFPSGRAALVGHTDARGDQAYNQRLSERRARSVRQWLIDHEHLDGARVTASGLGKRSPIGSNTTDEGRQKNRRVEVVIDKRR